MKKLIVNIVICICVLVVFIYGGIRNSDYGFFQYYFNEKLDLLVSLLVILITSILNIVDYERKKLSGEWSVFVSPVKWELRKQTYIGDGRMILTELKKRQYKGYLYLDWKNDEGIVVVKGFYEIKLISSCFGKVIGKSIMMMREDDKQELLDIDRARINFCNYYLKSHDSKLEGKLIMNSTKTESKFWATKEI